MFVDGEDIFIDVDESFVVLLKMCLLMYKLCVDVEIIDVDFYVYCGFFEVFEDGYLDLCDLIFGWCVYCDVV